MIAHYVPALHMRGVIVTLKSASRFVLSDPGILDETYLFQSISSTDIKPGSDTTGRCHNKPHGLVFTL